jgi:hypothetical protein
MRLWGGFLLIGVAGLSGVFNSYGHRNHRGSDFCYDVGEARRLRCGFRSNFGRANPIGSQTQASAREKHRR